MIDSYVDVRIAAELTGEHERTVRRKASENKYISRSIQDAGVGKGGLKLQILVSSLPAEAQIKFIEQNTPAKETAAAEELIDVDMAAYREKYGEEGMKEFIFKYDLVQKALDIEMTAKGNKTELWVQLAEDHGMSKRSLDRMVKGFKESGAIALMRKIDRADKGKSRSTCHAAKVMLIEKRLDKVKRTKTRAWDMVLAYAEAKGKEACESCIFREGAEARAKALDDGIDLPACEEEVKDGMKISKSIKTISRILDENISEEIYTYACYGKKAWEAKFMHKATREKPKIVNEVWFGDHHVFDVFIKDMDGKIVKPWLTAWQDGATGCIVGWCLSTNPNSQTIAEAFAYGVSEKKDFPFWGVPWIVYTDNGKDYRSHAFEGGKIVDKNFGKGMPLNIETDGILKQLGVENIHAKAYHGWAKPIERTFGTFADRYVRELPGWCGRHPHERPEGFEKELKKLVEQDKLFTLEELKDWFIGVLNEYHNTGHGGYGDRKPIDIYMNSEKARLDKPSWAVLSILKMQREERLVTTQGITFDNKLYWHKELVHLTQQRVKIRYNKENKDTIIVIHDGKFVCAANVKETLKMVREDEEKIARHVSNQKTQEREVKERIAELLGKPKPKVLKKSNNKSLTGEILEKDKGNVTSIEHEKAMKAYNEAINDTKTTGMESGVVDRKYLETGEEIFKKVMNK